MPVATTVRSLPRDDPQVFPFEVLGEAFNLNAFAVSSFPQGRNVTQYQFVDDLSWTKGAHSLKFGGNFRRYDITDYIFSEVNNPEVLLFDAGTPGTDGNPNTGFFYGLADQTRKRYPSRATQPVALWGLGLYAQDEVRVNKSLKLTFALRAEHNSNPVCNTGCGAPVGR